MSQTANILIRMNQHTQMSFAPVNMAFTSLCEELGVWYGNSTHFFSLLFSPSCRCDSGARGCVTHWRITIGSIAQENNYDWLTSSFLPFSAFFLGGGWLEVRCHGNWPNLPLGFRAGVCARNDGTLLPASHQFPRMTADRIARFRPVGDTPITRMQPITWITDANTVTGKTRRKSEQETVFIFSHSDCLTYLYVIGVCRSGPSHCRYHKYI